jgi:MinD-like ATPase involved in chromosome partitioning or flagellar assembly
LSLLSGTGLVGGATGSWEDYGVRVAVAVQAGGEGASPIPRRGARPVALGRPQRRLAPVEEAAPDRIVAQQPSLEVGDLGSPQLQTEARRRITRPTLIAVTSLAGGVGRTTVTAAVGQMLATVRQAPVVAVDATAQPQGMLASRLERTTSATAHELLAAPASVEAAAASSFLNRDPSGLLVLAGDRPATGARMLAPGAVAAAIVRLSAWYPLTLADFAASPADPAAWPWIRMRASTVLVVARATGPDLSMVAEAIPVLMRAGLAAQAGRIVVVANQTTPGRLSREAQVAEQLAAARVKSVVRLPYDDKLAEGRPIHIGGLRRRTRMALLQIAAACGARFQ